MVRKSGILLVLFLVMASVLLGGDRASASHPCPYRYPDGRVCGGTQYPATWGQDQCDNPNCPGPGSIVPPVPRPDDTIVIIGNIGMQIRAGERWERRFGSNSLHPYIDAVRKAHPTLQNKMITITIGPSNEFEFFSDGNSITHLVWPVLEGIRNERMPRVPVVAGYFSSNLHIEQKGNEAGFNLTWADGSTHVFNGKYQEVNILGNKMVGFYGKVKTSNNQDYWVLIRPIFGARLGVELLTWYDDNGRWVHKRYENPANLDLEGKANSPRM